MAKPRPIPSLSVHPPFTRPLPPLRSVSGSRHPPFTRRFPSPTVHSATSVTHHPLGGFRHPPFTRRHPSPTIHSAVPVTHRSPRLSTEEAEPFGWICNPAEMNISICNAPPRVCNIVFLPVFRHCKCLYSLWSDCKSDQTAANPTKRRRSAVCRGRPIPEQARLPVAFVPARTPDTAFIRGKLAVQISPDGAAGWHGACPYTRRGLPM